jgi:hypothetical protein
MDGTRTFAHLATELTQVYGYTADAIYNVYVKHNPLKYGTDKLEQYWEHTRKFMEDLHRVLYDKTHQLSLHQIRPESYYFLIKTCIDHAFSITELISIRNDREKKYAKDMANDIAHNIIPPYLTYRKQTINCNITGSGVVPGPVALPPGVPPMPPMPPQQFMPFQMPMPFHPFPMQQMYMPPTMPMPMPMQMPFPPFPPFPPMQMPMMPMPMQQPTQPAKIRPVVKQKPVCIRNSEEKAQATEGLVMPLPSDDDNIPLNFYSVYCTELANRIKNPSDEHNIPQILPVPNRPPPPL